MAFGAAMDRERVIPGAVATLGVSDRVAFLRRAYGLLGIALVTWAVATGLFFRFATETSAKFSAWALRGQLNWLLVIGLLMASGMFAQWLARSEKSRTIQLLGLGVEVAAWTFLMQPLLWVLFIKFKAAGMYSILAQGTVATAVIFVGLTATVFVTKKDFSFLRGVITVGMFAAMGIIVASMLFGFTLGLVFTGALIALLALKILYDTSLMLNYFPPTHYVSAALMLFGTVATLFWNIIIFLMKLRSE